ncbi:MAG: GAF domain-containing protein [Terriglobales bacterium]
MEDAFPPALEGREAGEPPTVLATENRLLDLILSGAALQATLKELARLIERLCPHMLCSIVLLDADGMTLRHGAAPSLPVSFNQAVDGATINPKRGVCGPAVYRKQTVIVSDIEHDPLWADCVEVAAPLGLKACWSEPIVDSRDRVRGSFASYYRDVRSPTPVETAFIQHFARLAGIAIERAGDRQSLTACEARSQRVAHVGTWHWNLRSRRMSWSDEMFRLFGLPPETCVPSYEQYLQWLQADDRLRVDEVLTRARKSPQSFSYETRVTSPGGEERIHACSGDVLRDEAGAATEMFGTVQDVTEWRRAEDALRETSEQLLAVSDAMSAFLETGSWQRASEFLLQAALKKTQSEYGFVGVMIGDTLRILAHEGIVWSQTVNRRFYEAAQARYREVGYLEFPRLDNLFGTVITSRHAVVSNEAPHDPGAQLPPGQPPLNNFLGVPIHKGSEVVGMIALANRPGGYGQHEQDIIETLTRAVGVLYDNYRNSVQSAELQVRQQRTEERYRHLLHAASDAIVVIDLADGLLLEANDRLAELLGVDAQDFPGMREADLYPEGERLQGAQLLRHAVTTRHGRVLELKLRRSDGRTVTVEASARSTDLDGRPVLLGIFRDVSEVKRLNRALLALSRCNQELVRAREESELLAEICRIIVTTGGYCLAWVAEPLPDKAKTVRIVAQHGDVSGYLRALPVEWGDTPHGRGPVGTALRTGEVCMVGNALTDPCFAPWRERAIAAGFRATIALPLSGETGVFGAINIYSTEEGVFDPDEVGLLRELAGNVAYGISTLRIRAERQRAEAEVVFLSDQLRHAQKMEALGRLAGGIAHDFNNLLTVIRGYAELAMTPAGSDPNLDRKIAAILQASDRAQTLVSQLLAFSRKQVLQPVVLDLNQVLAEAGTMLPRLIGENIRLEVQPAAARQRIMADPAQIQQIIINLAVNARDAMAGGGSLRIATDGVSGADGDLVLLTVSDTGTGIPIETQGRIFEPFFTTKEVGKGTGLGLSMVYGAVSQSGGRIEVESQPGQGTTFKIYFPATQEPVAVAPNAPSLPGAKGVSGTILLVEDEASVRDLVCEFLQAKGYTVTTAVSGHEGLEKVGAPAARFDLIISDVVMPGLGGREMVERIRMTHPSLKVLLMSGYMEDAHIRQDIAARVEHYIEKPFQLESLAAAVSRILED